MSMSSMRYQSIKEVFLLTVTIVYMGAQKPLSVTGCGVCKQAHAQLLVDVSQGALSQGALDDVFV